MRKLAIYLIFGLTPLLTFGASSKNKSKIITEQPQQTVSAQVTEPEPLDLEEDLATSFLSLRTEPTAPDTAKLFSKTLFFLFILGIGAFSVLYLAKKGRFNMMIPNRTKEGGLKVVESKMLGNKQFLMVVEYGNQKMLLGVGPGMINHLCYLNTGLNENEIPREALTQRQEVL